MRKQVRINVEVGPKVKAALKQRAAELKVKPSVIVRWAIDSYFAANPSKEAA